MITDFDDAYANMPHIPGGADYPARWSAAAAKFRSSLPQSVSAELNTPYGQRPRQHFDLFRPPAAKGLVIFVHGGYWMRFHKDDFSHLAAGPLARGWSVALPAYTLTPEVTIADIVAEITAAITTLATLVPGPIRLCGHSAGGHLVTRQICTGTKLPPNVLSRIAHVISISGVHDLRPLLQTAMREPLRLDEASARTESPALLEPLPGIPLTCWVGAEERPEFIRQSELLANILKGFGMETSLKIAETAHHFNVIDALLEANTELAALVAP
jgi:arylformamidase